MAWWTHGTREFAVVQQAFPHQEGVTGVIGGASFPPSIGACRRLGAINHGCRYLGNIQRQRACDLIPTLLASDSTAPIFVIGLDEAGETRRTQTG